jgi:hypothetical protein
MAAGEELGAWRSFTHDLGTSARTWAKAPMLVVISVAFGVAQGLLGVGVIDVPGAWMILLAYLLIAGGWYGTQRIWYLRAWRGAGISPSEVLGFTFRFVGRYFRLGLIAVAILLPFTLATFAFGVRGTGVAVALTVVTIALDFLLTFATPALAFTTASASEALSTGMRILRDTWPKCALYAVVPPLAITAAGSLFPDTVFATGPRTIYLAMSSLVGLWFKGAAAAFYVRHYEVGDDGSVFMNARREMPDTFGTPGQPERPR